MEKTTKKRVRKSTTKTNLSTNALLKEGKKLANELLGDGLKKANQVEDSLKVYTDDLSKHVKKHPLASVAIASGIGFLLSRILR